MAGIGDLIDMVKGVFSDKEKPERITRGKYTFSEAEYEKMFNFLYEKGFDSDQIDQIHSGEVDQEDLVPSRQKRDDEGNLYVEPGSFKGAKGGIADLRKGGMSLGPGTETSDDIPAMLSDGEFVLTARAVRGIGGGSRKKGAEVLYDLMKEAEDSVRS